MSNSWYSPLCGQNSHQKGLVLYRKGAVQWHPEKHSGQKNNKRTRTKNSRKSEKPTTLCWIPTKASIWSIRGGESQGRCATASRQGIFLCGGVLPPPGSVPFGYGSGGSNGSGFNWWEHWRFKLSFSNGKWCRRWVFLWDPNNIFSSFLKGGYQ